MKRIAYILIMIALLLPSAAHAQLSWPLTWTDPAGQKLGSQNPTWLHEPEHWVYWKYYTDSWFGDVTMTLWAHNNVKPEAEAAVARWTSRAAWLSSHKVDWKTDASSADVDFNFGSCGSSAAMACTDITTWASNNTWKVNYGQRWIIKYTPLFINNASQEAQIVTLVHEFGHVLGRGEAYNPDGTCGAGVSIMDAMTGNNSAHCDGLAYPTNGDMGAYGYSWTDGEYGFAGANGQTWFQHAWEDYAWNDWKYRVQWYYMSSSYGELLVKEEFAIGPQGSHQAVADAYPGQIPDRMLYFSLAPGAYGVPAYSSMRACTTPYFRAALSGERRCTPWVQWVP